MIRGYQIRANRFTDRIIGQPLLAEEENNLVRRISDERTKARAPKEYVRNVEQGKLFPVAWVEAEINRRFPIQRQSECLNLDDIFSYVNYKNWLGNREDNHYEEIADIFYRKK